ncbi:MAG: hypothetical protein KBS41_03915 [Oscillospiraceae bacterium]|nr:hypothetical protein [Candidatus Equicaccousia limihippi]
MYMVGADAYIRPLFIIQWDDVGIVPYGIANLIFCFCPAIRLTAKGQKIPCLTRLVLKDSFMK